MPQPQPQHELQPQLSYHRRPADPRGIALVLHGGREASLQPVRPSQLAVLRMIPFARRISSTGRGKLVVARLRYGVRGWNGELTSPVGDARWAIEQLVARYPGIPMGIVGHSMGGRTALRVGGHPAVRSVVGLAAWLPPDEPISQLTGRQVLLMHGSEDHMTSALGSAMTAARLREAGITASYVEVSGEHHAMLRRPGLWHDLAAGFVMSTLLGQSAAEPASNLLRKVIEGEPRIMV